MVKVVKIFSFAFLLSSSMGLLASQPPRLDPQSCWGMSPEWHDFCAESNRKHAEKLKKEKEQQEEAAKQAQKTVAATALAESAKAAKPDDASAKNK